MLTVTSLLQAMIKACNSGSQTHIQMEEMYRARDGEATQSSRALPRTGACFSPGTSMRSPTRKLCRPRTLGPYGSFITWARLITDSTFSHVQEKMPSFWQILVFLVTSPHPGATQEQRPPQPRKLQGLQEFCVGTGG